MVIIEKGCNDTFDLNYGEDRWIQFDIQYFGLYLGNSVKLENNFIVKMNVIFSHVYLLR